MELEALGFSWTGAGGGLLSPLQPSRRTRTAFPDLTLSTKGLPGAGGGRSLQARTCPDACGPCSVLHWPPGSPTWDRKGSLQETAASRFRRWKPGYFPGPTAQSLKMEQDGGLCFKSAHQTGTTGGKWPAEHGSHPPAAQEPT